MNGNEKSIHLLLATEQYTHSPAEDREAALPEHLIVLPDNQWALWRCVCLRGAGFPADQIFELAVPACTAAADQLIQAQDEFELMRSEVLDSLVSKLDHVSADQHAALVRTMRAIRNAHLSQQLDLLDLESEGLNAFLSAFMELGSNQSHYNQVFNAATVQVSQAIHELARVGRFREAVLWQNRQALHTGIASLLRQPPGSTHQVFKQRKHEALVANYLQRYCMKNDTVGFFGPVGFAKVVPTGQAIAVRPGTSLIAARKVYFERWCIDALAETLAQEKGLLPWCAPRCMPHIHLDGTTLYVPFARPLKLNRSQAAILQACNGERTAKELARDLVRNPANELKSEEEVYELLEWLSATKRISWTLETSPDGAYPERALRQLLERVGDKCLRTVGLEKLDELERARDAISQAAGDPEQLDLALGNLETSFMCLTDMSPTRSNGKTYAARTLVYEDCRRDIEVELGPELVLELGKPLALLLTSARWFTYHTAALYHEAFMEAYTELAEEAGSSIVDFADFWLWVQPLLFDEDACPVDVILEEFQQRWSDIFSIPDGQSCIEYTSDELYPRVLAAFDVPAPGWRSACYHSPDLLIQASSPEAILRGDYRLVLGELHIAMNTLQISAFMEQYPSPEELLRNTIIDLPEPRILPVLSRQAFPISRVRPATITPKDYRLEYAADACAPPQSRILSTGSLVVEDVEGRLVVRTRDAQWRFEIIEVFAEFLSRIVYGCFKIFGPGKRTPRVVIDRMVIARESWYFSPAEINFAFEKVAAKRFIEARHWTRTHNLPRFVFVKVPGEQKPCFIDFESPIYVDIFAKMIRRNMQSNPADTVIAVSEMLPGPDQMWLPDGEGHHYASELRFVAVDLALPCES